MKYRKSFSVFVLLILSACSAAGAANSTSTPDSNAVATSAFATAFSYLTETSVALGANASPTPSATPSRTPAPKAVVPTTMPTIEPMLGTLKLPSNIRSGPGKGGNERLGGLLMNQQVKVIGRDVDANWLWIIYPDAPGGTAWVLSNAVKLNGDLTRLPIAFPRANAAPIVFPPIIYEITGTPLPLNTPATGAKTATITELAKVRLGPGLGYSNIGTIPTGTVVTVTGHVDGNGWLQIEYPSGLDGHAWISGQVAHMNDEFAGLPFFNLMATPVSAEEAKAGISFDSNDNATPNPQATAEPNSTPAPTQTPEPTKFSGATGEVYQASQINVRGGPASSYDPLGTLNTGDKVIIIGETINQLWYQISYPAGPSGYGWVSTKYIKITGGDMNAIHYFDTQGTPLPNP